MPRQDTATPPPENRLLDAVEQLFANRVAVFFRRGDTNIGTTSGLGSAAGLPSLHWIAAFGGVSISASILDGIQYWRMSSNGITANGRQGPPWPLGRDHSSEPASSNRPLRWVFEGIMRRASPILTESAFGWGCRQFNGTLSTSVSGQGIALESNTLINGGNWSIFQRLLSAGALTNVDTGISGATDIFFRLLYDDTTNPRLQWFINGASVFDVTGLLLVPRNADGTSQNMFQQFAQGGSGMTAVGQIDRIGQLRWIIDELPGF